MRVQHKEGCRSKQMNRSYESHIRVMKVTLGLWKLWKSHQAAQHSKYMLLPLHIGLDNISAWVVVQLQGFQEGWRWKKRQTTLGTTRRLTLDISCGFTPRQPCPHYSLGRTLGDYGKVFFKSQIWVKLLVSGKDWNLSKLLSWLPEAVASQLGGQAGQQSSPKLTEAPLVKMWPPRQ